MKLYLIICISQTYNNLQDEIISAQKVLLHGITSRTVHQLIRCGISGGFFSRAYPCAYLDTFALRCAGFPRVFHSVRWLACGSVLIFFLFRPSLRREHLVSISLRCGFLRCMFCVTLFHAGRSGWCGEQCKACKPPCHDARTPYSLEFFFFFLCMEYYYYCYYCCCLLLDVYALYATSELHRLRVRADIRLLKLPGCWHYMARKNQKLDGSNSNFSQKCL